MLGIGAQRVLPNVFPVAGGDSQAVSRAGAWRSDRLGEFFEKVERHWRKVDVEPLLEDEAMELTNDERQTSFLLSLIEERW